jgi:hippurate hydrolase
MVTLRRDLHRHPELSGEEVRTAQRIADELEQLDIEFQKGIGGHGVVAELPGSELGPVIALRADMDALPIVEQTGLPFASEVPGQMHACGHDGHAAILLGAAMLLKQRPVATPVRLIWQPAEETASGAEAMLREGVLDCVAMVFGGHLDRNYPAGTLAISEGAVNASTDTFRIVVSGQDGHGARPHEALDAVVAGSLLVTALQTIVSRELDPAQASVVSVGSFHAGSAPNVIAGRAVLEGTIRAQHSATREHVHRAIERIAKSVGLLHGATVEVEIRRCTPALNNSAEMVTLAREAAEASLGQGSAVELVSANMGGEDFAHFLTKVPGCYVRFGSRGAGQNQPAHSSRYDFDERSMAAAAAWFSEVAHRAAAAVMKEATGERG